MSELTILYTDNHITVCIKPPELSSQQDSSGKNDMLSALYDALGSEHKPVHRLDRGVGGVMVYAKTELAAKKLSASIQDKSFKKEYLAVVEGVPSEKCGIYKDLLFKDSSKNKSYVVDRQRRGVKEASLEYSVLETKDTERGSLSLVKILLHTGRTHQIRVQFGSRRTAVFGDGKYGSLCNKKSIALFSHRISFAHPATNKPMSFEAYPEQASVWEYFTF